MIRRVLLTMAVFFCVLTFLQGGFIMFHILCKVFGESGPQTYLYPFYGGLTIMAGMIAFCTHLILNRLKELEEKIDHAGKEAPEPEEMWEAKEEKSE